MIKIEKKPFGYRLIFSGVISTKEVEAWLAESDNLFEKNNGSFSVLVDMRDMELLPVACQGIMRQGQKLYKRMGMDRSAVVVRDKLTAMQFRLIAQKTGIYSEERYINAALNLNWEKEALGWILHSVEPSTEKEPVE